MVIFINGSFGVGKTTIARQLIGRIPQSNLFDPELIGFALRGVSKFIPLNGCGTGDFQDMPLWRKLTWLTAMALKKIARRTVVMPMTFANPDYLNQVRAGLLNWNIAVHHFCLLAPVPTVYERLQKRGIAPLSPEGQWIYPRAANCCRIHQAAEFGEHIDTNRRSPDEITDDIYQRIQFA